MTELARIVEALLFAADSPLRVEQIREVLADAGDEEIRTALHEVQAAYEQNGRGVGLYSLAGGYQLLTRPDVGPWVERFLVGRRRQRLSRAALEVLAIVAYRQPITRGEIELVRGVDCGAVMQTLLERRLVAVRGRAKRVGHPLIYATTDRFLEHFGIRDLSELPKLEEFRALLDRDQAREELQSQGVLLAPESPDAAAGGDAALEEAPPSTLEASPESVAGMTPAPEETPARVLAATACAETGEEASG